MDIFSSPSSILFILLIAITLFIWGKWRYDIIAIFILLLSILIGVVPPNKAFDGFSNPAVITIAFIMILSHSLTQSGILKPVVNLIKQHSKHIIVHIGLLLTITATLSAFINNVGALGLMLPVALQTAKHTNRSPSMLLMPIAFGSVLGGLCTSIGTPPNLLISAFRLAHSGKSFELFDFSPVGVVVALTGLIFITLIGWKFLPKREAPVSPEDLLQLLDYITEIKVTSKSPLIGLSIKEIEKEFNKEITILGLIRKKRKRFNISKNNLIEEKDILIIETAPENLKTLLDKKNCELAGGEKSDEILQSDNVSVLEAVVPQGSRMEKRSALSMNLRSRFRVNIVGIARQGKFLKYSMRRSKLRAGDVVLLQGNRKTLSDTAAELGLLPLIEHTVAITVPQKVIPLLFFVSAIALTGLQILSIHIALLCAILSLVLLNQLSLRDLYKSIDWPIIILIGAFLPLGAALQTMGGTALISNTILFLTTNLPPIMILGVVMLITMTLSDAMNNAATAVIMAPIALTLADTLHLNPDSFLMAVAIGASCSFLTPISHQNNTIVLGPGGYHFFDYFRLGLPLELIILSVSLPLLAIFWPIYI